MHINIGVDHKVNPGQIQHVQDTMALKMDSINEVGCFVFLRLITLPNLFYRLITFTKLDNLFLLDPTALCYDLMEVCSYLAIF